MKPTQVYEAIKTCIAAKRVPMLWGPPGIYKTSITRQLADELGIKLIAVHAAERDPVDVRGVPYVDDGVTRWALPAEFVDLPPCILFLDEFVQAPPAVQNVFSRLILDRCVDSYQLPDHVAIVAAGNRLTDKAATNPMPTHIKNRLVHINCEISLQDWETWAYQHEIAPEVIAFIKYRPEQLHYSAQDGRVDWKKFEALPTPRTWEFVSDLLHEGMSADIEHELITGTVGECAAVEFSSFLRIARELPDVDLILRNPKIQSVPEQPAALYALCTALAARADAKTFANMITYVERIKSAEFRVLAVRDCVARIKSLQTTREFIAWAVKYQEVVI